MANTTLSNDSDKRFVLIGHIIFSELPDNIKLNFSCLSKVIAQTKQDHYTTKKKHFSYELVMERD